MKSISRIKTFLILSCFFLALLNCNEQPTDPSADFSLVPFKQLAQNAVSCSNHKNKLYLIDKALVFWDRAGTQCIDNGYSQILFGKSKEDIKCEYFDSESGPTLLVNDSTYYDLFQTIKTNSDLTNLGLGTNHTVENIPF